MRSEEPVDPNDLDMQIADSTSLFNGGKRSVEVIYFRV